MNSREKYEYWLDIAEYDLETANATFRSGRYLYVVFMCQQAIEKLVKGIHVLYMDLEAPRSHNISLIFNNVFNIDKNKDLIKDKDFENTWKQNQEFFAELLYYYISERYPSYKQKLSASISQEEAKKVLDKTEVVFKWIKSLNQYK